MDTTAEIKVSDALIEKYRYTNTEHIDWWDSTYETFKEDMKEKGIEVDDIYFSGFYSQGDGACFEGKVCDWEVFLKTLGYENNPTLIEHAKNAWRFSVRHSGHYYHENCTTFSGDLAMPCDQWYDREEFIQLFSPYDNEFRSQAWFALLTDGVHADFEELFKDTFKDHMRDLYRRLEEEYDHLTSDEAVKETIIANDLFETDEEGE